MALIMASSNMLPIAMDVDIDIDLRAKQVEIKHEGSPMYHTSKIIIDTNLLAPIIRQSALQFFETHQRDIYAFWSWLSRKTHLPISTVPGDGTTLDALAAVDGVILTQHDCSWKLRLAYVQLIRLTTALKSLIVKGSRRGRLRRTVGKGNTSILIDIYVKAQRDPLHPSALRQNVQKRLRLARRWADLIGGSIFLAAAYCSKADAIV